MIRRAGFCWALLLAAGEGRRFGGAKLMAPLAGRPLVAHVLEAIALAVRGDSLAGGVAVVAAGDGQVAAAVHGAGLRVVWNQEPPAGLAHSIRLGLAALSAAEPTGAPGAAVLLAADQPCVRPEVIATLASAWRAGLGTILRPRYADAPEEPGHPVLLDRSVWHLTEGIEGDTGLGPLLKEHPEWVVTLDVAGSNPDVDTPAHLAALQGSRGIAAEPTRRCTEGEP